MKLLLVEAHDITTTGRSVEFGFTFDYVRIRLFVGCLDTVYLDFRGISNEISMNNYQSGSDKLTTLKIDNAVGAVPLNQYEFMFTKACSAVKWIGTAGVSSIMIEYYAM